MAVNLVRKSKNEDEEERRKQLLAQIQQNSQARKDAEIQSVKDMKLNWVDPTTTGFRGATNRIGWIGSNVGAGAKKSILDTLSAPMQSIAVSLQRGANQAAQENSTWDKIKNYGKNALKTYAYTTPDFASRLLYMATIGRQDMINENHQVASQIAQNYNQAQTGFGKAGAVIGGVTSKVVQDNNSLAQGLYAVGQQVGQLIGEDRANQATQKILEADTKLHEKNDKRLEELQRQGTLYGGVTRKLGETGQTIGYMTPSIAIGLATGGAGETAGLVQMGLAAKGSTTREAMQQGADLETAERKGVASGTAEVLSEKMFGGLKAFKPFKESGVEEVAKKYIAETIEKRISSQLGQGIAKTAGNWLVDVTGETIEELTTDIYDTWLDQATTDPNAQYTLDDAINTAVGTTLSTTVLNVGYTGLNKGIQKVYDRNQARANNQESIPEAERIESNGYKENLQEMVNNLNIPEEVKAQIQPMLDSNATINAEEYKDITNNIKTLVKANTQQQIADYGAELTTQYNTIEEQRQSLDNIKPENFKDQESRRFYAQQMNKEFSDNTLDTILATYPENRNGNRTVKQYKEIAKAYGQQMALNGLTFDEVRANTVGAWQYYEPNKNITRYDNQQKKNVSFERLNSQVWSEEVYNSYRDTMKAQLDQQQQELGRIANDRLNEIQDEENILIDTIDNLKPRIEAVKSSLVQSAEQYGYKGKQISEIQDLMKRRGINAYFDETQFNNDSEGAFYNPKTNEIVFNPNASQDQVIQELAVHEWYHDLKAKGQGEEIQKSVIDFLKNNKDYQDLRKSLENAYAKLTDPNTGEYLYDIESKEFSDMIDEEATAKTLQRVLGNETEIQRLINYKPSLARRIYDAVVDLLNKFTGGRIEKLYWQDVRNKFEAAFNETGIDTRQGKIRFDINGDGKDFFYRGQENEGHDLSYNSTRFIGSEDEGFYFTPNKETASKYGKNLIEKYRNENNTVTVAESDKLQKMATDIINDHMKKGIWEDGDDILEQMALGRSKAFAEYTGKPFVETGDMFGEEAEAVYYPEFDKEESNTSTTDNQGRTLTKEQQEYFEDSKNRDSDGNLKTMYHGTEANAGIPKEYWFSIFDKGRQGDNGSWYGNGFYFTENEEQAKDYAHSKGNVYEVYLDVKNPYIPYKNGNSLLSFQEDFKNNFEEAKNIEGKLSGEQITNILKKNGYDGIIIGGDTIVFEPNQIKNVDNKAPTTNSDIRYNVSLSNETNNDGEKLSNGQVNYFANSKARDENGQLITVYHGTNRAGFTTFNRNYNYYTDSKSVANSYTQGTEMVDTRKLENINDAKNWLREIGINDMVEIRGTEVYDKFVDKTLINYENEESLLKNIKNDLINEIGSPEAGGIYEGYVNITNPIEIDAQNEAWSKIPVDSIKIKGIDNVQELFNKYGSDSWVENGKTVTSTNDIVDAIKSAVDDGDLNADGVIIRNVRDEGGYGDVLNPKEIATDYITFDSNQFKAKDNLNPTADPDIRYQNETNFDDWANNNLPSLGEGKTTLGDLRTEQRLPVNQPETTQPILPTTNVQPTTESLEIPNEQTSIPLGEQVNPSERKQREAYKSIIESPYMSEEAKKVARKFIGQDTYTPDSNLKQLERADNIISRLGVEKALNQLESNAMEGRTIKAEDIATGDRLIEYYSKIGDSENLQRAIRATAMAGTQAGRSVQAFALLKHQTPQGMAVWIQNSVDKLNSQTKNGQFDFTTEMQEKILNSTEDNLQENVDEVMKELGQQVPQSLLGKLDTWRYFSMLANPKTHIRNIVGNFAMGLTQQVKSKVAGTIEQVTGQDRTHTSLFEKRSRANIDFAKNDLKNVSAQLGIGESKYSNPKNQIQQNQRVFKSDALEKSLGRMFKLNDNLLEAEDNFGLKNAYVRNLSDYMTANKLNPNTITNEQLQQARKVAVEEALRATFHQESSLASMLNQLEKKNGLTRTLVGGLVPFKKTPINVAKSGFEYSPAGLAKAIVYDSVQLRKGNINVNEYIDNISKGLTGTGIALVGYALAEAGILKAGGDDDKEDKYKEAMGEQEYSINNKPLKELLKKVGINVPDSSYSLDWLAPTGIPLFVGAELNKLVHDTTEKEGETQNEVLKAIGRVTDATSSLLNPMSEMSMISGLTSTIQSFSTDPGGALMNLVVSPVKSYVGQVVPTAVGQVARTMDKYERDTSSTETGLLPKAIDQTKNQIMNKIPGLRQLLPTKKDIWGNEVETQDYFHNAVLPYTKKEVKTNAVDKELNDLYERTGESIYPNTSLSKTVTYEGSKTRLTNQDYNEFKTNYGKTSYKLLEDLTKSQEYKGMTDAQKVQAIKDVYTYANNLNKTEYAEKKGIEFKTPTDVQQVRAVKAYGGKESDYFKYKGITDGLSKDSEKMVALRDSNLSAKSKRAVYSATLGKDDTLFQSTNIDVNEYLGYKTANIQGTKDSSGKTISGTKKTAQLDYINNNISGYENRLLLMGKDYKLSRSQQQDLAEYIYTLDNADDLFAMYDKNFTVRDGTVYYK